MKVALGIRCCLATVLLLFAGHASAQFFQDDFDDGVVASRYSSIQGGALSESGGKMHVAVFAAGDGVKIDLTGLEEGVCTIFEMEGQLVDTDESVHVSLRKEVVSTGQEFSFVEFDLVKTNSTRICLSVKDNTGSAIMGFVMNILGDPIYYTIPDDYSDGWNIRLDWGEDSEGNEVLIVEVRVLFFIWKNVQKIPLDAFPGAGLIHEKLKAKEWEITGETDTPGGGPGPEQIIDFESIVLEDELHPYPGDPDLARRITLVGTTVGGDVGVNIAGIPVSISTVPGESAELVLAKLGTAINGHPSLEAIGAVASYSEEEMLIIGVDPQQITFNVNDAGLTGAHAIPALSTWALLVMATILCSTGVFILRRCS